MAEVDARLAPSATVLVIDDSPENRYVVRRALTRAGMSVLEAGTGAEGSRLAAEVPDLIVLDVNLPDTTGFELCRQFKADPATAHVPVIHLSQSAVDDRSQVRGLEGGADAYLTDPVRGSVLVATIRALLRMRHAEDELRRQAAEADRLAYLASRLAAAQTEGEVITGLLEVLTASFPIRRAYLFGPRPWFARTSPSLVFNQDPETPSDPLPGTPEQVNELVDAILEPGGYENHLFYETGDPYAWMVLPLVTYGREMGTLLIEFAAGVVLPERNQVRLGAAAERCAQALERARLAEEQRAIAFDLQTSLLPAMLPDVPGVELAAQYRAGAEGMVVGGDFYDVFRGAYGWSAMIGDVCGRGAVAAARTSLARHTAREAARHDDDPAALLMALARAIDADKRPDALDLITAVCLQLSPGPDGVVVRVAIAGHPLPILITANGDVAEIGSPGSILGVNPRVTFRTVELTLAPGDTLFLYTDGLTDARCSGVLFGEQRLIDLLGELAGRGCSVQELASIPVQVAADYNERHDDDMATLVLRADG